MRRSLVALLALGALGALGVLSAPRAHAQEPAHVVDAQYVGGDSVADLRAVRTSSGAPVRVLVRGTITSSLDGEEIDAVAVYAGSAIHDELTPVVFPPGSRLVETRGAHEYVFDVPAGDSAVIVLNVPALAARLLVTGDELRRSLRGAIVVDVVAPSNAPLAVGASSASTSEASVISPFLLAAPFALGIPLLGVALFLARRRRVPEDVLLARAGQARASIVREARTLGPAFDGALSAADALRDLAVRERAHLAELDRALSRTAWVRGHDALAARASLLERRATTLSRLGTIVARLEDTVVRMAACVADRSAIAGVERDLEHARTELELGEAVEREIASFA